MPLSTKVVYQAFGAMQALIKADRENALVLSSAIRIRLAGCLRKAKPHAEEYEKEFAELAKKYGTKNEEGNLVIAADSPELPAFEAERDALEAEPTDIEAFAKFTETDLMGKPDPDGKVKQNQIDLGVLTVLLEVGILTE